MNTGDRYEMKSNGWLTVSYYNGCNDVGVVFDGTEEVQKTSTTLIKRGKVRNRLKRSHLGVGYLGIGVYSSKTNGKKDKAYSVWSDMLARCYSKRVQKKQPTYAGCSVCEEWHNFQNFAEWYYSQSAGLTGRYDIDKDIKVRGNKIYSPEACVLVSHKENAQHSASRPYKVKSPDGNIFEGVNLTLFCEENGLLQSCMCRVINGNQLSHKGWTLA